MVTWLVVSLVDMLIGMGVCMYVCACVYYVCMHVHECDACNVHVLVHVWMHVHECMCVCKYTGILYVCMYVQVCAFVGLIK